MTNPIEDVDGRTELRAIQGEQLSAVTFVQDYVQLHFDGPTITAITLPVIIGGDSSLGFGSPGYRDALCALIGKNVSRAYAIAGDRLQVDFPGPVSVIISLRPEHYVTVEAALFGDGKGGQWEVW